MLKEAIDVQEAMHEREREHERNFVTKAEMRMMSSLKRSFDERVILNFSAAQCRWRCAILDDDEEPEMVSLDEISGTSDEAIDEIIKSCRPKALTIKILEILNSLQDQVEASTEDAVVSQW